MKLLLGQLATWAFMLIQYYGICMKHFCHPFLVQVKHILNVVRQITGFDYFHYTIQANKNSTTVGISHPQKQL